MTLDNWTLKYCFKGALYLEVGSTVEVTDLAICCAINQRSSCQSVILWRFADNSTVSHDTSLSIWLIELWHLFSLVFPRENPMYLSYYYSWSSSQGYNFRVPFISRISSWIYGSSMKKHVQNTRVHYKVDCVLVFFLQLYNQMFSPSM